MWIVTRIFRPCDCIFSHAWPPYYPLSRVLSLLPIADKSISSDYINPIDLCNRLNTYIVPEAAVQAFLTFLFVINGYWIAIILNLPLLAWNGKK